MGEKLLLEKSVAKFKSDLSKMASENKGLSANLSEKLAELEKMEKENKRFRSTAYQVDGLKKQKAELEAMMKELERDMKHMSNSISDLTAENSKIRLENKDLMASNSKLTDSVNALQEVAINNSLVEAVQGKKKQRSTVLAKRTRGLKMEVDLPASMTENLKLKVIDPQGKELTDKDGIASITEVLNDGTLTASLTMMEGELVASKRMKLQFEPKAKMKQGTYTLEVSNSKKSLGKIQIKLR
jgi:regulator of replication initiation timing